MNAYQVYIALGDGNTDEVLGPRGAAARIL